MKSEIKKITNIQYTYKYSFELLKNYDFSKIILNPIAVFIGRIIVSNGIIIYSEKNEKNEVIVTFRLW